MDKIPVYLVFVISIAAAILIAIVAQFYIVPWQRKKILNSTTGNVNSAYMTEKPSAMENGFSSVTTVNTLSTVSVNAPTLKQDGEPVESEEQVNQLFNFLQILAAIFSSFAHGGNDVR